MNVKVKRFKKSRVNKASRYAPLEVAECRVIYIVKGTGLKSSAGKEDPVEFDSNLDLCSDIRGVA